MMEKDCEIVDKRIDAEDLPLSNDLIASRLEETADLLEVQGANPYRIRAYRGAGELLHRLNEKVSTILEREGVPGLERLPGIGPSLARTIERLAVTGKFALLEKLHGRPEAESLFVTVAGIGVGLATEIHEHLGIETLPELAIAASDGRLAEVPGMGSKRVRAVQEALAGRLMRSPSVPRNKRRSTLSDEPDVSEILDVDREYREKSRQHRLPRISPKHFNPTNEAWLPVLHTERWTRHYTALYSNTARAHELGTIRDWVIIYRDDHEGDGQWTVITASFGENAGKRIVRGRERECSEYYKSVESKMTAAPK